MYTKTVFIFGVLFPFLSLQVFADNSPEKGLLVSEQAYSRLSKNISRTNTKGFSEELLYEGSIYKSYVVYDAKKKRILQKDIALLEDGGVKRETEYKYTDFSFYSKEKINGKKIVTGLFPKQNGWESVLYDKREGKEDFVEDYYIKTIYDKDGRELSQTFFDGSFSKTLSEDGIFKIIYVYNRSKYLVAEKYYGFYNKPTESNYGIHKKIYYRDRYGNLLFLIHKNAKGRLTPDEFGVAIYKYKYDYRCLSLKKESCNTVVETRNSKNKLVEKDYIFEQHSPDNKPVKLARIVYQYDKNGHKTFESFFGANGKLKEIDYIRLHEGSIAGQLEDGQVIYEGTTPYKVAMVHTKYDDDGNLLLIETFNKKGKPVGDRENGIAKKVYQYNYKCIRTEKRIGNCFSYEASFGTNGKLKDEFNYAEAVYDYNEYGELQGKKLYSANKKLVKDTRSENILLVQRKFSKANQVIEEKYVDLSGKNITERKESKVHKKQYQHDSNGNRVLTKLYDTNDQLIAVEKVLYDVQSKKVSVAYFDRDKKFAGGIKYKYKNSLKGLVVFYDKNKKLGINHKNISYYRIYYNPKCIINKNDPNSCFSSLEFYNPNHYLKEAGQTNKDSIFYLFSDSYEDYLNAQGIAGHRFEYDAKGNLLSEETFGEDRKMKSSSGYADELARTEYEYDPDFDLLSFKKISQNNQLIDRYRYKKDKIVSYESFTSNREISQSDYNLFLANPKSIVAPHIYIKLDMYYRPIYVEFQSQ